MRDTILFLSSGVAAGLVIMATVIVVAANWAVWSPVAIIAVAAAGAVVAIGILWMTLVVLFASAILSMRDDL